MAVGAIAVVGRWGSEAGGGADRAGDALALPRGRRVRAGRELAPAGTGGRAHDGRRLGRPLDERRGGVLDSLFEFVVGRVGVERDVGQDVHVVLDVVLVVGRQVAGEAEGDGLAAGVELGGGELLL